MKKTNLALFVIVATLAILGLGLFSATGMLVGRRWVRGSGNVIEETRPVSGLTGVSLATIGHLFIEVGDTESLRIEAEDNVLKHLKTEVRNGNLRIGTQNFARLNPAKPVNYFLTVTKLDTIKISSSGDVEAPDLRAEELSIDVSSSGNLEMGDLETEALNVKISSSGDVTMGLLNADGLEVDISSNGDLNIAGGEVRTQTINISSSGQYMAPDLVSDEADARLSSNGSATIWVQERLKASLSSSGDLVYRGNPTVDARTTSSGQLVQIGE